MNRSNKGYFFHEPAVLTRVFFSLWCSYSPQRVTWLMSLATLGDHATEEGGAPRPPGPVTALPVVRGGLWGDCCGGHQFWGATVSQVHLRGTASQPCAGDEIRGEAEPQMATSASLSAVARLAVFQATSLPLRHEKIPCVLSISNGDHTEGCTDMFCHQRHRMKHRSTQPKQRSCPNPGCWQLDVLIRGVVALSR